MVRVSSSLRISQNSSLRAMTSADCGGEAGLLVLCGSIARSARWAGWQNFKVVTKAGVEVSDGLGASKFFHQGQQGGVGNFSLILGNFGSRPLG